MCVGGVLYATMRRWWGDIAKLLASGVSIGALIVLLDLIMAARVGGHFGGDARLHLARIRFLLEHGISNQDPFVDFPCFFAIYHTNLIHALQASCSQLTGIDYLGVWSASLVWAKLVIAGACYFLAYCVFRRRWAAWASAILFVTWRGPVTYVVYPNQLASYWLVPLMIGFAVQAARPQGAWSVPLKLAAGSLVLGQVHGLYAVLGGMVIAPALGGLLLIRMIRRQGQGLFLAVCLVALGVAAPFVLIGRKTVSPLPASAQVSSDPHRSDFHQWENGWWSFKLERSFLGQGFVGLPLLGAGAAVALAWRRRRQAAVVVGVTAAIACILFVPPVCTAAVHILGRAWMVARLDGLLAPLLAVLGAGTLAFVIEPITRPPMNTSSV